jgi:hypothetical protein
MRTTVYLLSILLCAIPFSSYGSEVIVKKSEEISSGSRKIEKVFFRGKEAVCAHTTFERIDGFKHPNPIKETWCVFVDGYPIFQEFIFAKSKNIFISELKRNYSVSLVDAKGRGQTDKLLIFKRTNSSNTLLEAFHVLPTGALIPFTNQELNVQKAKESYE